MSKKFAIGCALALGCFSTSVTLPARAAPCDLSLPAGSDPSSCRTPRDGTLSGVYLSIDGGYATLKSRAADRVGAGGGAAVQLRLGVELWDQLVTGIALGGLFLADERPTSELVMNCTDIQGTPVACDNDAHSQASRVGATLGSVEAGYQKRFRPMQRLSWSPGAMLGYTHAFGGLKRGVDCNGCGSTKLDAQLDGAYIAPFVRLTFGKIGELGIILRSQWYFTGDLSQFTVLGLEYGLP
jgi:hypothetical protein